MTPTTRGEMEKRHMARYLGFVAVLLGVLVGPGKALAQGTETVVYFHTDAIGSVRMTTDVNGQVIERHDYAPFGEPWPASPAADILAFGGNQRDSETTFGYFGARYLASGIGGRFTTVDPGYVAGNLIDSQSWNAYAYARNNPLRFIDPDGLECKEAVRNGVPIFCGGTTEEDPNKNLYDLADRWALERFLDPIREAQVKGFVEGVIDTVKTLITSPRQSCLAQVGLNTAWNLPPIEPGVADLAEPAAAGAALLEWNRAQRYAASRPNFLGGQGLLYANRSSVYRRMVNRSKFIVGKAGPAATAALAVGEAIVAEAAAWQAGACR